MTRILQIRRGSAAQNDNFTGLPGEITFDTTNKRLRVHDGATLGGYQMARADEVNNATTSDFDINSVSDDFWNALFATHQTQSQSVQIQSESSALLNIVSNVGVYDTVFSQCTQIPISVRAELVCKTAEAGYSVGDTVCAFGTGDYTCPLVYTYIENGALHARLMVGGQTFWVAKKSDGTKVNITNDNWKIKITVYY